MISKRLENCANFVRKGNKVCDVGCDHGYTSCYLIKEGLAQSVIAADVNEKPLKSAIRHIQMMGYSDKIKTVLSDGLANISKEDADDIIIAGMGGELILRIISDCDWVKDTGKALILQPMTNVHLLRIGLYELGFEIKQEKAVFENGHWYTIINSFYTAKIKNIDGTFANLGTHLNQDSESSKKYVLNIKNKFQKLISNLELSNENQDNKIAYYKKIIEDIDNNSQEGKM